MFIKKDYAMQKLYLKFFILFLFSTPSWAMEPEQPLTTIVQRAPSIRPERVVFDIDGTLCVIPQAKSEIAAHKFPNAHLIKFETNTEGYSQSTPLLFFPGYGEVILTCLNWGWHVDFFSSEFAGRNEALIPAYLKVVLEPYSLDIEADYEALIKRGKFNVFSHHHLSYVKNRKVSQYEQDGDYKKDLSIIGDIKDTILVDDDLSYACQIPYIGLDWNFSYLFRCYPETKEMPNYAPYILGILAECKECIDEKRLTLRQALSEVLKKLEPWKQFNLKKAVEFSQHRF